MNARILLAAVAIVAAFGIAAVIGSVSETIPAVAQNMTGMGGNMTGMGGNMTGNMAP
jgi:hypothetical protein